jgi:hypothetical protein
MTAGHNYLISGDLTIAYKSICHDHVMFFVFAMAFAMQRFA